MAQTVKNPAAMRDTWVWFLGWEDPWRRAWQPTSVFLSGESPWTEEPGVLQSFRSQRVEHDWELSTHTWFCAMNHLFSRETGFSSSMGPFLSQSRRLYLTNCQSTDLLGIFCVPLNLDLVRMPEKSDSSTLWEPFLLYFLFSILVQLRNIRTS